MFSLLIPFLEATNISFVYVLSEMQKYINICKSHACTYMHILVTLFFTLLFFDLVYSGY